MSDRDDRNVPVTTTDAGVPAASDEYPLTVGPDGPVLLQDRSLIQKMAQFNRERVPERVVHLKAGVEPRILRAAVEYWKQVDANLRARVAQGVGL